MKSNTKFDELAKDCYIKTGSIHSDHFDYVKFGELIVQECAELFVDQRYMILNPNEPFANERVRVLKEHDKDTVRKIKEHFGVEK